MMNQKLVQYLRKLGLTEYEAKAIAVLVDNQKAKAIDISIKANIPKTRIYDVLERLEKKGFVIAINDKPISYKLSSLESVIKKLLEEKKSEINKLEEEFQEIKRLVEAKSKEQKQDVSVFRLKKISDFVELLKKEINEAKKSIKGFSNLVVENDKLLNALKERQLTIDEMKIIHSLENIKDHEFLAKHKHDLEALLIDDEKVVLAFKDDKKESIDAIFLNNKHIVEALNKYFNEKWQLAKK